MNSTTSVKLSANGSITTRVAGPNTWMTSAAAAEASARDRGPFKYNVLDSEEAVGQAMFDELVRYANENPGDIVLVLLGGRGAQAMYRLIRNKTEAGELDDLLGRLHVFTQDALAPMRMDNGLSFVRDFERLLGPTVFSRFKSFTPMLTETEDIEGELARYIEKIQDLGGIDLFFLGLGPEAEAASHVCYLKPGCGLRLDDLAGIIPISGSILEHHISKFKAGGSSISERDEEECRRAGSILTLGPAAILGAKRIIHSIVDASTAPAKRASFKRMIETEIAGSPAAIERQVNENPGLLLRLHGDVRSYVLADLLV